MQFQYLSLRLTKLQTRLKHNSLVRYIYEVWISSLKWPQVYYCTLRNMQGSYLLVNALKTQVSYRIVHITFWNFSASSTYYRASQKTQLKPCLCQLKWKSFKTNMWNKPQFLRRHVVEALKGKITFGATKATLFPFLKLISACQAWLVTMMSPLSYRC